MKKAVKKHENQQSYLKLGMYGFTGSGKSFTATLIAIGLKKYARLRKPVMYVDTEGGIDFTMPMFDEAGVDVLVKRTRSFADLLDLRKEAEKDCSIMVIDSTSHFWADIQQAYEKKKNLSRLSFHHWKDIKEEWGRFTNWYTLSNIHILMLARAKWIYDYRENEEGKMELIKEGTGMRLELDFSYEASLLLEMERVRKEEGRIGSSFIHRCWVTKDRANKIDGKYFDNPDFSAFVPHIEVLNLGGDHKILEQGKSSEDLFKGSSKEHYKRKEIALETIQNELTLRYPSRSGDDHTAKLKILKEVFKTHSWTEIKNQPIDKLERGALAISKLPNPKKNEKITKEMHPAEICREILDFGVAHDISVKKFIYKWSDGEKEKLSDFNLMDLKQIYTDLKKYVNKNKGNNKTKSKGGKK